MKLHTILPNKRLSSSALGLFILGILGVIFEVEWVVYAIIPSWLLFLVCVWKFATITKRTWLLWVAGISNLFIILEIASYILYFETYNPSPLGLYLGFVLGSIINIVSAIKIRKEKMDEVTKEESKSQRNDVILWIVLILGFFIFIWLQPK